MPPQTLVLVNRALVFFAVRSLNLFVYFLTRHASEMTEARLLKIRISQDGRTRSAGVLHYFFSPLLPSPPLFHNNRKPKKSVVLSSLAAPHSRFASSVTTRGCESS
jgi:hypothetical protein